MNNRKARGLKSQLFIIVIIAIMAITVFEIISFSQIRRSQTEKTKVYLENRLSQIRTDVDSTLAYIRLVGYELVEDSNIQKLLIGEMKPEILDAAENSENIIYLLSLANRNIKDVVLVDRNDDFQIFFNRFEVFDYRKLAAMYDFKGSSEEEPFYAAWSDSEESRSFAMSFILPVNIVVNAYEIKRVGSVIVYCVFDYLENLFNSSETGAGESYYLLDSEGKVLARSRGAEKIFSSHDGTVRGSIDLGFLGWSVEGRVGSRFLSSEFRLSNQLILFNLIMSFILILGIYFALNRNFTKPILKIASEISSLTVLTSGERLSKPTHKEFDLIVSNVNRFLETIEMEHQEVLNKTSMLYENNLARKQTELSALQSQINPHFLYNTLECMRSIAAVYQSNEIMDISTAMADIFRYSIKGDEEVSLKEELDIVRKYLTIMDIRFGGKYKTSIDIPSECLMIPILRMSLQPLVENAFYHGLERKNPPGTLLIKGELKNEKLSLIVSDTGKGIDAKTLERINSAFQSGISAQTSNLPEEKKIGMMNIHIRCQLAYGEDFGISVQSREDEGTLVAISYPVKIHG